MIGERIKQARQASGLSLRALAERVGVSAQAISKYERDLDTPSSDVLLRLAQALSVRLDYFFRTRNVTLSEANYRKRTVLGKKEASAITNRVKDWLERYLEVEDALQPGKTFESPVIQEQFQVSSLEEVEEAAEKLRRQWDLGTDPIDNLLETMEDHGIRICLTDAPEAFDACTYWAEGAVPVIVIKEDVPGDRQRFNAAHELGHIVLKIEGLPQEKAAYAFAGAFLVPKEAMFREMGMRRASLSLAELISLKQKYGISIQTLVYRAKQLGIISDSLFLRIMKSFRARGWHKEEPGPQVPEERPERFDRLVLRALTEDLISESKAAELLGMSAGEFHHSVKLTGNWQ